MENFDAPTATHIATAAAIDSKGKARFGVPGPGAYDHATSIRGDDISSGLDNSGRQVYRKAPAYVLGIRNPKEKHPEVGQVSNGPASYLPSTKMVLPSSARAVFGSSSREKENQRYVSEVHNQGVSSKLNPGPGTYRVRRGKGHAKTLGDGPTWKFGTESQRVDSEKGLNNLGPIYDLPSSVGTHGPKHSFAPQNDRELGLERKRGEMQKLFISKQHARIDSGCINENPGPGTYWVSEEGNSKPTTSKAFSFAKQRRENEKKEYISKHHTSAEPESISPGPVYDLPSTLNTTTVDFGTAPRLYAPELGGNCSGPIISALHSKSQAGIDSPGPAHYKTKARGLRQTDRFAKQPTWKFGTFDGRSAGMSSGGMGGGPGPGTYMTKKDNDFKYQQSPSYSVGPNLRTDFTESTDTPGPGAYKSECGFEMPDIRKPRGPTFAFGWTDGRLGFVAPSYTPGPGTYKNDSGGKGPRFTFGVKERCLDGGKSTISVRFHSKTQAKETVGMCSPGPGAYDVKDTLAQKASARLKFGTGQRTEKKLFISKSHSAASANDCTPGPGAYSANCLDGVANKHKNRGAFSFGTSTRPPLATITF